MASDQPKFRSRSRSTRRSRSSRFRSRSRSPRSRQGGNNSRDDRRRGAKNRYRERSPLDSYPRPVEWQSPRPSKKARLHGGTSDKMTESRSRRVSPFNSRGRHEKHSDHRRDGLDSEFNGMPERKKVGSGELLGRARECVERETVIKYRDNRRVVSSESIILETIKLDISTAGTSFFEADEETRRQLSRFLGAAPPPKKCHPEAILYLSPLQTICVRWYHAATGKYRYSVGHAFAFGRRYLFTADHLVEPKDQFQFDGVYLTDPRNPYNRTNVKLDVFHRCPTLDVAILESKIALFKRLELHSCDAQSFETVYHVDYLQRYQPNVHPGKCYSSSIDAWEVHGRSDAKNSKGYSGGPVVLRNGWCVGMHIQGGEIDSKFVTTEGLLLALEKCHSEKRIGYDHWGIKFFGDRQDRDAKSGDPPAGPPLWIDSCETVRDAQLTPAEIVVILPGSGRNSGAGARSSDDTSAGDVTDASSGSKVDFEGQNPLDEEVKNQYCGLHRLTGKLPRVNYSQTGRLSPFWAPERLENSVLEFWKDE